MCVIRAYFFPVTCPAAVWNKIEPTSNIHEQTIYCDTENPAGTENVFRDTKHDIGHAERDRRFQDVIIEDLAHHEDRECSEHETHGRGDRDHPEKVPCDDPSGESELVSDHLRQGEFFENGKDHDRSPVVQQTLAFHEHHEILRHRGIPEKCDDRDGIRRRDDRREQKPHAVRKS